MVICEGECDATLLATPFFEKFDWKLAWSATVNHLSRQVDLAGDEAARRQTWFTTVYCHSR